MTLSFACIMFILEFFFQNTAVESCDCVIFVQFVLDLNTIHAIRLECG